MPTCRSAACVPSFETFTLSVMLATLLPGCVQSLGGGSGTGAGGGGSSAVSGGGATASSTTSAGGAGGATGSTGQGGGGAAGGELLWARPYPCTETYPDLECGGWPEMVDVDAAGNIVFAFRVGSLLQFDYEAGDTVFCSDWDANVIARYDSSGHHLWHARDCAGGYTSRSWASSSALLAGGRHGSHNLDYGFVERYSAPWTKGKGPDWVASFWGSELELVDIYTLTEDAAGNAFVFGNGAGVGDYAAKLAKLDATGKLLWIREFGTAYAFTPDGAGGSYVVSTQPNMLNRLDANGSPLWQTSLPAEPRYQVKTDSGSAPFLFLDVVGDADLGGGVLPSVGLQDITITKLDPAGHHLWSKRFGAPSTTARILEALIDAARDVVVISAWQPAAGAAGAVDFGGGALPSVGVEDLAIAKFDAAGHHLWSKRFGAPGARLESGESVHALLDGAGNLVMSSMWKGGLPVGLDEPVPGATMIDASLVKLDAATGATRWAKRDMNVVYNSFAIAPDGGVIVATTPQASPGFVGNLLGGKPGLVLAKLAP